MKNYLIIVHTRSPHLQGVIMKRYDADGPAAAMLACNKWLKEKREKEPDRGWETAKVVAQYEKLWALPQF